MAVGTTHAFIPFLCIHRTHLLPIPYSSSGIVLDFARVSCLKNEGDTEVLLGLSCSIKVLKLRCRLGRDPVLKDWDAGEVGREDAGESDAA